MKDKNKFLILGILSLIFTFSFILSISGQMIPKVNVTKNLVIIDDNQTFNNDSFFQVIMPENDIYYRLKVQFKIKVPETVKKIDYINLNEIKPRFKTLCLSCSGYGLEKDRMLTMVEGPNNLIIRVLDSNGTEHIKNINLVVDSVAPIVYKTEPRENKVINGTEFSILYTSKNLQNISLIYGNYTKDKYSLNFRVIGNCSVGKNKICRFNINLSQYEGEFMSFYYELNDWIYTIDTQLTSVKVDTPSPTLSVYDPIANYHYYKKVIFNMTITKKSSLDYMDTTDDYPVWRNLCKNCESYGYYDIKSRLFRQGEHDFLFRSTDKSGNYDMKSVNFTVD